MTSKRIISWILNADIILESSNHFFKEEFLKSIILQVNHLKKCLKFEKDEQRLIEILTAILLTGLIFKEYNENLKIGLKGIKKIVDDYFDGDGFPISRNPYNLLKFLKHFILIKECTKEAQEIIPEFIENILDKKELYSNIRKRIEDDLNNKGSSVPFVLEEEKVYNLYLNQSSKIAKTIKEELRLTDFELFSFLREKKDTL